MTPAPTPVLYFTGGIRIGGMETHLLHLFERIDRTRFAPHICCLDPSEDYASRVATRDVPLYSLDIAYLNSPGRVLKLRSFFQVLRKVRPCILHTYGSTCDILGPVLGRTRRGLEIITTRRGEDDVRRRQQMRSLVNRFTDCIVCVSEETRRFTERTESIGGTRMEVIPNGVIVPEISRTPGNRLRFGTLGTVKEIKGTDLLVDAFLMLPPDVEAELVIGGRMDRASSFSSALVERAAASPQADRVRFAGYQSDATAFYEGIDVFVLPSRSEGMSNALLEAMAAKLPCIATDVGSNRSVLHDTVNGLEGGLITEPTSIALHQAMAAWLDDAAARETAARAGCEIIARGYEMAHMVRAHESLYESLLCA